MERRYAVIDVFSDRRLLGNPVAVVLDADGLEAEAMQRIARWTNLSETTFLLPPTVPGAAYRLRIFTPVSELPFAGHPTLGSAHAAVSAGLVGRGPLLQECGAGLVPVQVEEADRYRLRLPEAQVTPLGSAERAALETALGGATDPAVPLCIIDVGPRWIVTAVADPAALLALRPDMTRLAAFENACDATGVTLFAERVDGHPSRPADGDLEVRSFAPSDGVPEDPVCGSGNGAVAVMRRALGRVSPGSSYLARQGRCVGRDGRIELSLDAAGTIWVGGACVTTVQGTIEA